MTVLQLLRRITLPVLVFLALLLAGCEELPTGSGPAGFEKVAGIINDEQGHIVPGASVEAFDRSSARLAADTTDETGMFVLTGLPEDLSGVQVRVRHGDFKPFDAPMADLISLAGGKEGVIMNLLGNDSCCARLTIVATTTDNRLLPGVEVKLRRGKDLKSVATTDSNGTVTFLNICGDEYNVRLARAGYAVVERDGISMHGCDSTRLEFTMRKQGNDDDSCCNGLLRIIPRDSATSAVIAGAYVQVKRSGGNIRSETTNQDGAIFREMCEGTYSVRISKEGNPSYRVVEFSIHVGCSDSIATDRLMVSREGNDSCCGGRAVIIPRDSSGNEVLNGAAVKIWKGNYVIGTRTVENGSATFSDLCAGEYVAEITRDGYTRQVFNFTLGCSQHLELPRYMLREEADSCCRGMLQVVVKDSTTNAPVAGVTVKLWKGGMVVKSGTTNASGVAAFDGLCMGKYGVDLLREGYRSREFTLEMSCNQRREMTQYLLPKGDGPCCTAKFVFRTKDSTNSAYLPGVHVEIIRGNDLIATGETSGDGRYVREALCGNAVYVIAFSRQGYASKTITIMLGECRTVEETIWLMPD